MKLAHILLNSQLNVTRLLLALSSLTWAVLLLLPGEVFQGRQTYAIMHMIADESIWGILFAVHGAVALYTLCNGTRNSVTLCFDGFLGCILWTSSTAACFAAHWPALPFLEALIAYRPPAAMSGEIWIAIASWWHLVKHWAEEEKSHYERGACKPDD